MATFSSTAFAGKAKTHHSTAPVQLMTHEEAASGVASANWANTDANILKMFKLPKYAEILGGKLRCGDSDSSTGLQFNVKITDGTTTKTLLSASTLPQSGGSAELTGTAIGWRTDNEDYYLYVEVEQAHSGTFTATATYVALFYSTQDGAGS